jgi:AcrR family transcriptional regulator
MKVNDDVVAQSSTRRTQAERTAATRALLISAARKLFADKGFAEVSTQAIVAAAGVTRGALYHQFEDEAALFVSRATNRDQARKEMDAVCDRLLSGIAGG